MSVDGYLLDFFSLSFLFFFFLHSTLTTNPFPVVESGSETEREAGSVYKVQELGVATRIGGRERVEDTGQSSAMAACSGSSVCTSPRRQQRC